MLYFPAAVRLWSTKLNANIVSYKGHNYPVWDVQVRIESWKRFSLKLIYCESEG